MCAQVGGSVKTLPLKHQIPLPWETSGVKTLPWKNLRCKHLLLRTSVYYKKPAFSRFLSATAFYLHYNFWACTLMSAMYNRNYEHFFFRSFIGGEKWSLRSSRSDVMGVRLWSPGLSWSVRKSDIPIRLDKEIDRRRSHDLWSGEPK